MINHSNENSLMDDANSPELDKKIFGAISEDFVKVADQLKEVSYQIRKRGFSDFPIFVVANSAVEMGSVLFQKGDLENNFEYRASFLQEFVDRKLVGEESVTLFKENYRDADEFACLFSLVSDFAGFVFIPFPED
jgi:hypothetical protein